MEDRRLPPRVLVETWLFLLESSETEEVRSRALEMLMSAFGNEYESGCRLLSRAQRGVSAIQERG